MLSQKGVSKVTMKEYSWMVFRNRYYRNSIITACSSSPSLIFGAFTQEVMRYGRRIARRQKLSLQSMHAGEC